MQTPAGVATNNQVSALRDQLVAEHVIPQLQAVTGERFELNGETHRIAGESVLWRVNAAAFDGDVWPDERLDPDIAIPAAQRAIINAAAYREVGGKLSQCTPEVVHMMDCQYISKLQYQGLRETVHEALPAAVRGGLPTWDAVVEEKKQQTNRASWLNPVQAPADFTTRDDCLNVPAVDEIPSDFVNAGTDRRAMRSQVASNVAFDSGENYARPDPECDAVAQPEYIQQVSFYQHVGFETDNGKEELLSRSLVRTLQLVLPTWIHKYPAAFEGPDLYIKIMFDGRQFGLKRHNAFTCGGLSIVQPGIEHEWSSDFNVTTLAEWKGGDDAERVRRWVDLTIAVKYLRRKWLQVKLLHEPSPRFFKVQVFLCADMKAQWAFFACGGTNDDHFCHRCKCHKKERWTIFKLEKPAPRETLQSIAAKHGISVRTLRALNQGHSQVAGTCRCADVIFLCSFGVGGGVMSMLCRAHVSQPERSAAGHACSCATHLYIWQLAPFHHPDALARRCGDD